MGNKLSAVRRLTPWHSFCFFFCFYLFFFFVQSSVSFFVVVLKSAQIFINLSEFRYNWKRVDLFIVPTTISLIKFY